MMDVARDDVLDVRSWCENWDSGRENWDSGRYVLFERMVEAGDGARGVRTGDGERWVE